MRSEPTPESIYGSPSRPDGRGPAAFLARSCAEDRTDASGEEWVASYHDGSL